MTNEELKKIDATFRASPKTINAHISVMESRDNTCRRALQAIRFECVCGTLRIISTNGRVMIVTETRIDNGGTPDFKFCVHALPKINAKRADIDSGGDAMIAVRDGLLSTGNLLTRITSGQDYPNWSSVMSSSLEPETSWKSLDPKWYALAVRLVGDAHMRPKRVVGSAYSPAYFEAKNETEHNTVVLMPLRTLED